MGFVQMIQLFLTIALSQRHLMMNWQERLTIESLQIEDWEIEV
jgi:hypothetical protein